jgi:hypothetical protein
MAGVSKMDRSPTGSPQTETVIQSAIMVAASTALERLLRPSVGDLPAEFAKRLLALDFTPADHARYLELSERAQLGTLSEDEQFELDDLLAANDVLTILHAKAKSSLKSPAA